MFNFKRKNVLGLDQAGANKWFYVLFSLFILLIPWQTRWIIYGRGMGGHLWQYGLISLYVSAIILFLAGLFFALSHKKEMHFSKNKFLYFLFAYAIVVSLFSPLPAVSFYYLFLIYSAALFAYLVRFLPKFAVFRMLLASGMIQGLLAIYQLLIQRVVGNKWLGIAEHLPANLGTAVVQVGDQRLLRAYGSLPHPNILGGFLFVAIFVGIYLWINVYKRSEKKGWDQPFKKKYLADFAFIITGLVITTYGLLASFSRSAVLALGLSLFSLLLINIFRRRWLAVSVFVKYIVIFFLVFLSFNSWFPGAWGVRWNMEGRLEQQSIEQRVDTYDQLGWKDYQTGFFGQGLGMNTWMIHKEHPELAAYDIQPIHDYFILLLAEVGMIGAFLLFNLVRMIVKSANQVDIMSTSMILGLIVIGLFDHYLWTSWTGWLLVALGLVNLYKYKE